MKIIDLLIFFLLRAKATQHAFIFDNHPQLPFYISFVFIRVVLNSKKIGSLFSLFTLLTFRFFSHTPNNERRILQGIDAEFKDSVISELSQLKWLREILFPGKFVCKILFILNFYVFFLFLVGWLLLLYTFVNNIKRNYQETLMFKSNSRPNLIWWIFSKQQRCWWFQFTLTRRDS